VDRRDPPTPWLLIHRGRWRRNPTWSSARSNPNCRRSALRRGRAGRRRSSSFGDHELDIQLNVAELFVRHRLTVCVWPVQHRAPPPRPTAPSRVGPTTAPQDAGGSEPLFCSNPAMPGRENLFRLRVASNVFQQKRRSPCISPSLSCRFCCAPAQNQQRQRSIVFHIYKSCTRRLRRLECHS